MPHHTVRRRRRRCCVDANAVCTAAGAQRTWASPIHPGPPQAAHDHHMMAHRTTKRERQVGEDPPAGRLLSGLVLAPAVRVGVRPPARRHVRRTRPYSDDWPETPSRRRHRDRRAHTAVTGREVDPHQLRLGTRPFETQGRYETVTSKTASSSGPVLAMPGARAGLPYTPAGGPRAGVHTGR